MSCDGRKLTAPHFTLLGINRNMTFELSFIKVMISTYSEQGIDVEGNGLTIFKTKTSEMM